MLMRRPACRMVNTTDIVELELKSKRFSLAMRKKEAIAVPEPPQVCRLHVKISRGQMILLKHGQHIVSTGQQRIQYLRSACCASLQMFAGIYALQASWATSNVSALNRSPAACVPAHELAVRARRSSTCRRPPQPSRQRGPRPRPFRPCRGRRCRRPRRPWLRRRHQRLQSTASRCVGS